MTKKIFIALLLPFKVFFAQTSINYYLPDTNCPSLPVPFYIDSNQVLDVQWDFCPGDLDSMPVVTTYGNLNIAPRQVQLIKENGNYYAFVAALTGPVSRIDFGNSMNNIPANGVNLQSNNISFISCVGIDIEKRGSNYYCFVSDASTNKVNVAKMDSVTQTVLTFTEIAGTFVNPYLICIYADYLFVCNGGNNTIAQIQFANGFDNPPTSSVSIATTGYPLDIDLVYDSKHQNYYAFCIKNATNELSVFSFGNSLINTPTETFITTLSGNPYSVRAIQENDSYYLFASILASNKITAIKLKDSITATPQILFDNSFPGMANPLGFALQREGSNWHGIASAGGSFNHFVFSNNCNATPPQINTFAGSTIINAPLGSYQRISIQATDTNYITQSFVDSVYFDTTLPQVWFTVNNFCTGLAAQFESTELLCFDTLIQRYWNFGDSTPIDSIVNNPTHVYNVAGTYTVTFTINTTQGNTFTTQQTITVKDAPVADFTYSNNQCADLNVLFTNTSTASLNDSIIHNIWSVDNVPVAQTKDLNFTFDNGGTYIIKLVVTNTNGCDDSLINQISILDSPAPSFSVTNSCLGGEVNFFNTTDSNNLNVTYIWNFGDTTSSNDVNPLHQYINGLLNHNVQLIGIGSNGCSDTVLQNIHLSVKPTPVIVKTGNIHCQYQEIVFANNSFANGVDSISSFIWAFGDNTFSNIADTVLHIYNLPGTYTVTLTAATPTFCDSSVTYTLNVNAAPLASYTAPPLCFGDTTQFINTSTVAAPDTIQNFTWYLADIDSTITVPDFSFYYQTGSHPVQLIVVSDSGCVDTLNNDVKVYGVPDVTFSTTNIPCSDIATAFNNTTTLIKVDNDSVATWYWNFGDNQFSGLEEPQHTYTDTLKYPVTLKAISLFGCSDSLTLDIKVNKSPEPYFTFTPACEKQLTFFQAKDSSTTQYPPTTYAWNFGLPNANSTFPNVPYYYDTAQTYVVTLNLTYNNGCKQKYLQPVTVNRKPDADFSTTGNCSGQSLFAINQSDFYSDSAASYTWSVNGNNISGDTNLAYIPTQAGNYTLGLIVVSNKTCSDTVIKNVNVNPTPNAAFTTIPTIGAINSPITFINQTTGAVAYNWSFGDNTSDNTFEPSHSYIDTNNFYVQLIAISDSNCIDTAFQYIKIVESFIDLAVNNVEFTKSNQQLSFSAIVKNNSNIDIQYFTITARIEGLPDIIDNPQIVLKANNGFTKYSFGSSVLLNANFNPRYVCIEVTKPNGLADQVKANDNTCVSITGGFEITLLNTDNGSFEMAINSDIKDECTYEIFDMQGKIISTNNLVLNKGLNYVHMPFYHTNGQYMVRCINKAGETTSRRLFIVK